MKKIVMSLIAIVILGTSAFAKEGIGIGFDQMNQTLSLLTIGYYSNCFDVKAGFADYSYSYTSCYYSLTAQLKTPLSEDLNLTCGASYLLANYAIGSDAFIGLTVGFQKELAKNLMLDVQILPIVCNSSWGTTSTALFKSSTLGVSYVF